MPQANPAIKPGGAGFPVFQGSTSWRAFPWGDKGEELVIAIQFDFGQNGQPMYQTVGNGGFTYNNFQVDPRPYFGTRPPRAFKSLLITADFNPGSNTAPPYSPIVIQESSMGQLLYLTNKSNLAQYLTQIANTDFSMDSKASACFDLLSQPGSVFAFSQSVPITIPASANGSLAAGTAFLTTFRMQPFTLN